MRGMSIILLAVLALAQGNQKEWEQCDTVNADKYSPEPTCDPCNPAVYQEYGDKRNLQIFQKHSSSIYNTNLNGWYRFTIGKGRLLEDCPLRYRCSATYPIWLNGAHPTREEGIVEKEICVHYTQGQCCTYKHTIHVKHCGNYFVYLLKQNKPISSGHSTGYCVEPNETEVPDICAGGTFKLYEDTTARGELQTRTSTSSEPISSENNDNWYTFTAGKGTIKSTCPGINHCGWKYPMWVEGSYPEKEGIPVWRMAQIATSEATLCQPTYSNPLSIVKCGDKFYHQFTRQVSYSGFCVDEEKSDLCENAVELAEDWRGTTVDKDRDHCDTNGLNSFEDWYRMGVYQRKMPDHCVAPNKCGGDTGYFVGGNHGHPKPSEGIVGRMFYYASASSCAASSLAGYILNCGDDDNDDYIYKFTKPSGCDRTFCIEENPCSSTVYKKLKEPGRAGRAGSDDTINDATLDHGWYRFMEGEGVMTRSPILPGHSGATYPGWYDGEHPGEEGQETRGRACFVYNSNTCQTEREVSVRNCGQFFVYHLKRTDSSRGYTYEQDVCKEETMKLDQDYRAQYDYDALAVGDQALKAGWYEVTVGKKMMATEPVLYRGGSLYPGWMNGSHPTEDEGIVMRTVYFTTSNTNFKGSSKQIYVRNCGNKFMYYLRPHSTGYYYSTAEELCNEGSYRVIDQDSRLFSNPSQAKNAINKDLNIFKTYTNWYRFTNGFGRIAEYPRLTGQWFGGFQYPYQFPEGSHANVTKKGEISEEILMWQWRGPTSSEYTGYNLKVSIANCGNYFLYRVPPFHGSDNWAGLVVDDDDDLLCEEERYVVSTDKARLVSETNANAGSSDYYLNEGWYRFNAGLGYMPSSLFVGTQCSTTYHGHLKNPHPTKDEGVVENLVEFRSTSSSVQAKKTVWVKACDGFFLYKMQPSPGTNYRYCEATSGCSHSRELIDHWRVSGRKVLTGQYESKTFGNDGWVHFSEGEKRLPESPPPKNVAGCTYNGYIDSHPAVEEGAVTRVMRFPNTDFTYPIEVENCGDRYVYFLSRGISNDYCYAADVDVCSDQIYYTIHDERRLHYSHKAGTSFTRFDLDNKFNGWIRYTMGLGRMMEEAPAVSNMCYAEYQGWINGTHPAEKEGVVKRQVCWKYGTDECKVTNEISVRNCGEFFVYGISSPPPNNQYGHCVEQSKEEVCEGATELYNPKRGMLTPTTEYIQDQTKVVQEGYYRFTSGLGRLTAFPVKDENCGGKYRMLIKQELEKDTKSGDTLFQLQLYYSSGWYSSTYSNLGLKCDGYWVYNLMNVNVNQMSYCVEEDVCQSRDTKHIFSTNYLQWLKETTDNEWNVLSTGWYEVMVGSRRLSYSPADLYDCSATYPGYITSEGPESDDGIVTRQICYRTSDSSAPTASCQNIYVKNCGDKELYYLTKSPSASYAICVESDVCDEVEGTELDETWRLSGTPVSSGKDSFAIGWYRVTIGKERLAETRAEASCGATYPGWLTLGRHPTRSEGTVNTQVCYDTGGATGANCRNAQVVNCGSHYLYHLRPASTHYGVCIAAAEDSMCTYYQELKEDWRSVEYSDSLSFSDVSMEDGWYRFMTARGEMSRVCPDYQHGGGYYPSWADGLEEMPDTENGTVPFTIRWRSSGSNCNNWNKQGYVRNCGDYYVYWLPKQTASYTTYNTDADACKEDQYQWIDDEERLAWTKTVNYKHDQSLQRGWYRFRNGKEMINEECTPQHYGGTWYPGWMDGGHPHNSEVVERTVYFKYSTNCKQTSVQIKVKNCGSFYLYKLGPTASNRGYTIAQEPCETETNIFDQEDRSIYEKSTSWANDNSLSEGWYQFTSGLGVMPKSPPAENSCRTQYPTWLDGEDPSVGEGVVNRPLCTVYNGNNCAYQKEIKVRNCGNGKVLYYFWKSPPHTSARYCVADTMSNVCNGAKELTEWWRGSDRHGTGKYDRALSAGWYKFTVHDKRLASWPVASKRCGSTYPIWMNGTHADKGECVTNTLYQTNAMNPWWRSGKITECQCMNGEYIYYHNPGVSPLTSYEGTYCVGENPCNGYQRFTGSSRSPWSTVSMGWNDQNREPYWVRVMSTVGRMPTYVPEVSSCGSSYPAWYQGIHPTKSGVENMAFGTYCFTTSATAPCATTKPAAVMMCEGGFYLYRVVPTASGSYGYCADEDVCMYNSEEWGREEDHRLRYTSVYGYRSATAKTDSTLATTWYKIEIGLKKMPEECPGYMSCGFTNPGWMVGSHPTVEDGIVDRTVCFATSATECCGANKQIKVKACSRDGEQFYLYRLYKTSNKYGYCIDQSSDSVCAIPNYDIQYMTDERHGTGHYYDSGFTADYKLYTTPAWMEVPILQQQFLHAPNIATQYFCGGVNVGWVEDPAPGPNDGVLTSKACYRTSMSNEDCNHAMPLLAKNCNGKMRYLYTAYGSNNYHMCVEEDVCAAGNHRVFRDESWRQAFMPTEGTYQSDYRKIEVSPYRAWFRFEGVGLDKLVTIQQEYMSCGTQYPAWMEGEHPTEEEGVVSRKLYTTTSATAYTGASTTIYVKNCGSHYVYNLDFNWRSSNWALCVDTNICQANIREINDPNRLKNVWKEVHSSADNGLARGWYRFTNGFERMPEDCPIDNSCGTDSPGYLSQPHPEVGEGIVERTVCFGDDDQCCVASTKILVRNCGTHYVYRLYPTSSSQKYCVDESITSMCDPEHYTDLDDEWRGETVPYDAQNKHYDNQLTKGWYRFTTHLGRMPEYSVSSMSCGVYYPGYINNPHPSRHQGTINTHMCFSTDISNEGQSCQTGRVVNCGSYYLYQLKPTGSWYYGFCVAQDQCSDAIKMSERWRLIINPFVSAQSKAADNKLKKGWYRLATGHGTMPLYEPDEYYGGQRYPSWMTGDLPDVKDGEVTREVRFAGTSSEVEIRVKNCGEYYVYRLRPTPGATYVYSIDTDVCLHARDLDEEWRNMFHVEDRVENLHTDYQAGKDWYQFSTGFRMMAESPPGPQYSCGTKHPAYLNQEHPTAEDGVVPREVCFKEDSESDIYQGCDTVENIRVKNCGDYYAYQLNPQVKEGAYCVYNRKTSCYPPVVHAKYGELAVVNCTLNSEKDFDPEEVEWTHLDSTILPDKRLNNIDISDDRLLLNINNIADKNAGVYAFYIASTQTTALVEVILFSAVESSQKYYYAALGEELALPVTFNIMEGIAREVSWKKLPHKPVTGSNYNLSDDESTLTIKTLAEKDFGTYRCTVTFEVEGVSYTKHADIVVKLEEEEM